jgi:hypothetical protein
MIRWREGFASIYVRGRSGTGVYPPVLHAVLILRERMQTVEKYYVVVHILFRR